MRLTSSRDYTRPTPTPKMPPGLVELIEGLTKDVLKNNPDDLYGFCAGHMQKLLDIRDGKFPKKRMSLEQKIKRAQEKVREKIQIRLLQLNEMARHSNESQEKETVKQGHMKPTLEPEMKMTFESADLNNLLEQPIQHEGKLVKTSEVISHDPNETHTSNKISEEPIKQHAPKLITVEEENTNNKIILEVKESTTDINTGLPVNPATIYIEEMNTGANNMKESCVDGNEKIPSAPEKDHPTKFVEVKIDEKDTTSLVDVISPDSFPNPSSFDEIVQSTKENILEPNEGKIVEPTKDSIIEPIGGKIIEPTKEKIMKPGNNNIIELIEGKIIEPTTKIMEPTEDIIIEPTKNNIIEPLEEKIIEPSINKIEEHIEDKIMESTKEKTMEPTEDIIIDPTKNNIIEPIDEKIIEPSKNKIKEPIEDKIIEPTKKNIIEPIVDKITGFTNDICVDVESAHVIKESVTQTKESVLQSALNLDVPSDLIIDTSKSGEPAVDNINEMESKVHNETFPSSEFKTVNGSKSTSVENAALSVQEPNESVDSDRVSYPQDIVYNKTTQKDINVNGDDVETGEENCGTMTKGSCPSESKIEFEHFIVPEHITDENLKYNTERNLQTALNQDLLIDLKPAAENPAAESKIENRNKSNSLENEAVPVQEPSETLYSQSVISHEITRINKPSQNKEIKYVESDSIEKNGTVHVDWENNSNNTKGNNYEKTNFIEIKKSEEIHEESRLEKPHLKSPSNEVESVSINNPKISTNTETESPNETRDFKVDINDKRVVPDIVNNHEISKSQDIFVNSEPINFPSLDQNLIYTAHKFLDLEREYSSSLMEEKAIFSKKVTLLGNEDDIDMTGEKDELNEKSTVGGMDLETAAITIQKVFRTFLFSKSRTSTLDDAVNENSLDQDIDKKDAAEYIMSGISLNKERRPLGISRMDTVLQTVNEEKSLSQSTDESSLSSAATTIQAHVRGFLVRNKLASYYKTASNSSHVNSDGPSTVSLDGDGSEHKKTILNIHIVPERGQFMSRDESMITSIDLPLDSSPPSSINLHPLGYDKSVPRKQLKREDAIQSVSPPSNNSGKLSEEVDSVKDLPNENNEQEQLSLTTNNQRQDDAESCDTTLTISSTADTVVDAEVYNHRELLCSPGHNLDAGTKNKEAMANLSSDEMDVVTPFPNTDKTISLSDSESKEKPNLIHSGEFHDMVVQTQVKRSESSVVREFKNVLVYFLLWDKT